MTISKGVKVALAVSDQVIRLLSLWKSAPSSTVSKVNSWMSANPPATKDPDAEREAPVVAVKVNGRSPLGNTCRLIPGRPVEPPGSTMKLRSVVGMVGLLRLLRSGLGRA